MRNSKPKSKRNLAIKGEPTSKEEFVALIKEAEKGPFKPIENLVEEVKLQYEKKHYNNYEKVHASFSPDLSKEELLKSIKEAEKGPFYSHEEFIRKFNLWKKTLKK